MGRQLNLNIDDVAYLLLDKYCIEHRLTKKSVIESWIMERLAADELTKKDAPTKEEEDEENLRTIVEVYWPMFKGLRMNVKMNDEDFRTLADLKRRFDRRGIDLVKDGEAMISETVRLIELGKFPKEILEEFAEDISHFKKYVHEAIRQKRLALEI